MKRLLFLFWLLTSPVWASTPSFDGAVTTGDTLNNNPATLSITIGANANRALYAFHAMMGHTSACTTTSADLDGTSLTKLDEVGEAINTNDGAYLSLWRLKAPSTGSHTLTANFGGGTCNGYSRLVAYSLYSVDQTTPEGSAAHNSTGTTAPGGTSSSINVSSASGDLVIDGIGLTGAPTGTAGGSQTDRISGYDRIDGSSLTASGVSTTMSWSISDGSFGHAQIGVAVKGVAASSVAPMTLLVERKRR